MIFLAFAIVLGLGNSEQNIVSSAGLNSITLPSYPSPPFSLSYNPDGTMIAGSADRLLRIWDATTGATLIDFPDMSTTYVLGVTWSPDGAKIATASADQLVRIWNVANPDYIAGELLTSIQPITGKFGILTSVDWSPNGQLLAIGSADELYSLKIWNIENNEKVDEFKAGWVERLMWHPDFASNNIVVADDNGGITFITDLDSASIVAMTHIGRNSPAGALAWSSDGSQIAVGYSDGIINIWNTATDVQISTMNTKVVDWIYQLAWSSDDKQIASTNGDGIVQLWSSTTGELLHTFPGVSLAVDFSPDGEKLVYANGAGAIQIVDVPSFEMRTSTK